MRLDLHPSVMLAEMEVAFLLSCHHSLLMILSTVLARFWFARCAGILFLQCNIICNCFSLTINDCNDRGIINTMLLDWFDFFLYASCKSDAYKKKLNQSSSVVLIIRSLQSREYCCYQPLMTTSL